MTRKHLKQLIIGSQAIGDAALCGLKNSHKFRIAKCVLPNLLHLFTFHDFERVDGITRLATAEHDLN